MIRSLLTLGLCLFSHSLIALETEQDLPIPQAENVCKTSLSNGITVYVEEHLSSELWGSFKVVFKYPSGHTLYTFDSKEEEWDSVEDFFFACTEKALQGTDDSFKEEYPVNFSSFLHKEPPQEVAVIAIGDFPPSKILDLIEKYFNEILFNQKKEENSIQIDYSQAIKPSQVALNLSLPNHYTPIETFAHLKECWKVLLLQELFQQRLEECTRGLNEIWIHPHAQQLYPVQGLALVSEEEVENTLTFFLWHLEMLKNRGFYTDSFDSKKQQILHQLRLLASMARAPNPSFLSSYYKDQFLLGNCCYNPNDFLDASLKFVQEIEFEDLLPLQSRFLTNQEHKIQLIYPQTSHSSPLTEEFIEDLKTEITDLVDIYLENEDLPDEEEEDDFYLVKTTPLAKDWIRKANDTTPPQFSFANNTPSSVNAFYQLPLSEKEKHLIDSIISTMGNDNLVQLALNRRSIEKKGKKIEQVHPLRFMGHILSSHSLKAHVRTIKKSSFKWDAFIDGFGKRMREELGKNNVYPYIPGFAQLVGSTPEHINHYVQKKDWEGLVKSLL